MHKTRRSFGYCYCFYVSKNDSIKRRTLYKTFFISNIFQSMTFFKYVLRNHPRSEHVWYSSYPLSRIRVDDYDFIHFFPFWLKLQPFFFILNHFLICVQTQKRIRCQWPLNLQTLLPCYGRFEKKKSCKKEAKDNQHQGFWFEIKSPQMIWFLAQNDKKIFDSKMSQVN